MLDFKELPSDGDRFELLTRELLYNKGLEVYWSGKGADGGKDLLCIEKNKSYFKTSTKRWLIQCKHNAHSGKSVSISDLDNIMDSCAQHNATGYLLVCSTFPSSAVVKRLEEIQNNKSITTAFWDNCILERELLQPVNWSLLNKFMPKSARSLGWRINGIDNNFWYANYKNNIFYISLRIGTNCNIYLKDISDRINEIEKAKLPNGHYLRLRAVHFDDKYTNYYLFLDYLVPKDSADEDIKVDDDVYELLTERVIDGVSYSVDLYIYEYLPYSDNFDINHQEYYNNFIGNFKSGFPRYNDERNYFIAKKDNVREFTEDLINKPFNGFVESLKKINFIHILKCTNARVEFIDQFPENFTWENTIETSNYDIGNFFDAEIRLECNDFEKFKDLLNTLPQNVESYFELDNNLIFLPDTGYCDDDTNIYTLKITTHPALISSKLTFRKSLNQYLLDLRECIDSYLSMAK